MSLILEAVALNLLFKRRISCLPTLDFDAIYLFRKFFIGFLVVTDVLGEGKEAKGQLYITLSFVSTRPSKYGSPSRVFAYLLQHVVKRTVVDAVSDLLREQVCTPSVQALEHMVDIGIILRMYLTNYKGSQDGVIQLGEGCRFLIS